MGKDQIYIKHILDSIEFVETLAKDKKFEQVNADRLLKNGIIRELEIIGEASKRLSTQFKELHPQIPWSEIAGMRDKLIHDYFMVNLNIVWKVVEDDLPQLKSALNDSHSKLRR